MTTAKTAQLTGKASIRAGSYIPGEGLQLTPSQQAAAGPKADPTTVAMDVLRDGSFGGAYRHTGDVVEVPEDLVEALVLAGFAVRADRVERARQARDEAAAEPTRKTSTAVAPLGIHDLTGAPKPA